VAAGRTLAAKLHRRHLSVLWGLNALGLLHVVEAPDRDDIGVEVVVGFGEGNPLFESTKVCTLHRQGNGHGVGILVSSHWDSAFLFM
jgi:hypothetical protein